MVCRKSYESRIYEKTNNEEKVDMIKNQSGMAIMIGEDTHLIPVFQAQVVVFDVQLKVRQDKL